MYLDKGVKFFLQKASQITVFPAIESPVKNVQDNECDWMRVNQGQGRPEY